MFKSIVPQYSGHFLLGMGKFPSPMGCEKPGLILASPELRPGGQTAGNVPPGVYGAMTETTTPATRGHDGHARPKRPAISFEFFPPKTEEMERNLWETINRGSRRSSRISSR